jgi:hypothetical protein
MTHSMTHSVTEDTNVSKKQINVKIIQSYIDSLKDTIYSLERDNMMLYNSLELYKKLYHSLAKNSEKDEN